MQNTKAILDEINESLQITMKKYKDIENNNNTNTLGNLINETETNEKELSKVYGVKEKTGFSAQKGNVNNNTILSSASLNSSFMLNNNNQFQTQYDKVIGVITDIEKRINKDFDNIEKMIDNILTNEIEEDNII